MEGSWHSREQTGRWEFLHRKRKPCYQENFWQKLSKYCAMSTSSISGLHNLRKRLSLCLVSSNSWIYMKAWSLGREITRRRRSCPIGWGDDDDINTTLWIVLAVSKMPHITRMVESGLLGGQFVSMEFSMCKVRQKGYDTKTILS